ncbi:MAG: hypothetical protein QG566_139 [Patescibacteria group bacterium]|jgi:hypothetical protein|nr:hypothetical protein [Patescibacteria group bacterium]
MNEEIKNIILNKLGIANANPEMQEAMLEQAGTLIYQGALIRAMENMRDEEVIELEKLTNENATPEQVLAFMKSKVENFEKIIAEEAETFVSKANGIMSQIGEK